MIGDIETQVDLAQRMAEGGMLSDAEAILRHLIRSNPTVMRPHVRVLARVLVNAGRVDEGVAMYERHLAEMPRDLAAATAMILASQYTWPDDLARQRSLASAFDHAFAARVNKLPPVGATPLNGRRLRVGYVSGDFRNHSVGTFIAPLIAAHDRDRVEVHCFSNDDRVDAVTQRIRANVNEWHNVTTLDDDALAQLVRKKAIDVLIDLSGHTAGNRLLTFARRPAPLQMTYLGYPNTTGLSAMDGRITDAVADPPGDESASVYSERLWRLPNSLGLFAPILGAPDVAPPPFETNGFLTFGSVAMLPKINAAVLETWADVLRSAANSRLMLVAAGYTDPGVRHRIAQSFANAGVDATRLDFVTRLPFHAYLRIHERVDVMLDPFPFNGHTTTLQNLWMGVPVLTLRGTSHRGRMGASVLTSLALEQFITESRLEYVAMAARLAADPRLLAELRKTLRGYMLQSPSMDARQFARDFESLLLAAREDRAANEASLT